MTPEERAKAIGNCWDDATMIAHVAAAIRAAVAEAVAAERERAAKIAEQSWYETASNDGPGTRYTMPAGMIAAAIRRTP